MASNQERDLPENYIVLLEELIKSNHDLVAQNKAMRDQLETRGNQHGQALRELSANVARLQETRNDRPSNSGKGKRKRSSIKVPSICRVSSEVVAGVRILKLILARKKLNP